MPISHFKEVFMRIAINLGSSLLGKALKEQLKKHPDISDVLMTCDYLHTAGFKPDFVIIDPYTIGNEKVDCLVSAKSVLLDYGLSEEALSSLIIYNKIDGIIATDVDINLLVRAFKAISNGQIWIDNNKIKALVSFAENFKESTEVGTLSTKEREVVILVSEGHTNKQIAASLKASEQTVKTHLNSIFKKLNLVRRTQLVPLGMKLKTSRFL
jgi:DNA-binding NarL/FixJ family response regulator